MATSEQRELVQSLKLKLDLESGLARSSDIYKTRKRMDRIAALRRELVLWRGQFRAEARIVRRRD